MEKLLKPSSLVPYIFLSLILFFSTALTFYVRCLDRIITAMYSGHSLPVLNLLIRHTDNTPLSYYLGRAHLLFSHLVVLCIAGHLLVAAAFAHDQMRTIVVSFFATPTSALNLAVFRVAVLVTLLLDLDPSTTIWFSGLPRELQFAPVGMRWLLPHIPISKSFATVALILLVIVCFTGIIGFFTRTSLLLGLILSLYALGITQFYGKVSHDHCLIWFLAILAASPCGDALSVDAIRMFAKRMDKGLPPRSVQSICYSMPLRFAGLLLGIIYFFPGFWKLWTCGLDWAVSENMKYQMYSKWMEYNGWTPFFRLDEHPWLYRGAGLFTLGFETSFIFLILFPRLRGLAALGGVLFHSASALFMRIFFYDLLICYVAIFDVAKLFKQLGLWLFPHTLMVSYDANCRFCRKTIAAITVLDILDRVAFAKAPDADMVERVRIPESDQLPQDIRAVSSGKTWVGFEAFRAVATRTPLLWPILPLLYLAPAEVLGNRLWRRLAHPRACSPPREAACQSLNGTESAWRCVSVVVVGVLLLVANIYAGGRQIANGWPFACYPLFNFIQGDEIESVEMEAVGPTGEVIRPSETDLPDKFMPQRFRGLVGHLLGKRGNEGTPDRFRALWKVYAQEDPSLEKAYEVRFYRVTLCIVPERKHLNPIRRELILEMRL